MSIPVIDIFAGPGGLGEGFSSLKGPNGKPLFDIRLSIEKDVDAHKTLVWRSFFRQFSKKGKPTPDNYYEALQIRSIREREYRIEHILNNTPEGVEAKREARKIELGSDEWPSYEVDQIIKDRLGEQYDSRWILIGGPPCQAYSNVGRSRVGGINPKDHRVYLYKEYLRIIKDHGPSIFVMENVSGLLSAKVNDEYVFDRMIGDLKCEGDYEIYSLVKEVKTKRDYLIKSENYGIPQKRHRVILLGIKKELKHPKQYLSQFKNEINLKKIIDSLPKIRSGLNRSFSHYDPEKKYKNGKSKRVYKKLSDTDQNWENYIKTCVQRIKNWGDIEVNGMQKFIWTGKYGTGAEFVNTNDLKVDYKVLEDWFFDKRLSGIPNHESRSHLAEDLMRYLFASLYVEQHGRFPRLQDFESHNEELLPDHENVKSGKFTDRFRVQLPDKPATTVTSHISKDGHYFIHYDPQQVRSLTVREAARIQTFPDNYLFRGSRTQQYKQVGNAVPPFLANQIAEIVKKVFEVNDGGITK
jgi:DNA (cytosine-5)-methyltransferase 1